MKKLKGFTLAEVLITLAIIGFIAAVTMPGITVSVQKQQIGPAFTKAVNTLKTTNMAALQDSSARLLNQIPVNASGTYLDDTLNTYITWKIIPRNNLKNQYTGFTPNSDCYTSPDGITYLSSNESGSVQNPPKGFSGQYFAIYIDANGCNKAPNKLGKDTFKVLVDQAGQVIPYGSYMAKTYGVTNDTWETKCTNPNQSGQDAAYCAGAIFDNNGQIKYKY